MTLSTPVPALEVSTEVAPSTRGAVQLLGRPNPYTYACSATVTEKTNSKSFAASVVATPGRLEKTHVKRNDFDVDFSVSIAPGSDSAMTEVSVYRKGTLLTRQSSTIKLAKLPGSRYEPVK